MRRSVTEHSCEFIEGSYSVSSVASMLSNAAPGDHGTHELQLLFVAFQSVEAATPLTSYKSPEQLDSKLLEKGSC